MGWGLMREPTATNSYGNNETEMMLGSHESLQLTEINSTHDCHHHQMNEDDPEILRTNQQPFAEIQPYVYDSQMNESHATNQQPSVEKCQASSSNAQIPCPLLLDPLPDSYIEPPYASYSCTSSSPLANEIAFANSSCQQHQHQFELPITIDATNSEPSFLSQLQHLLQLSCLQHHHIQTLLLHLACQNPVPPPLLPSHHLHSFSLSHNSVFQKLTVLREIVNSIDDELRTLKAKNARLQQQLNAYFYQKRGDGYSEDERENEQRP